MKATRILCLWHVSSHSWVISQRTFSGVSRAHVCRVRITWAISSGGTSDRLLSQRAAVIVTQRKPFMGVLIPALLCVCVCTAQLAACRACLYCAAGPSTLTRLKASLAPSQTVSLFTHTKKYISYLSTTSSSSFQFRTVNSLDTGVTNVRHNYFLFFCRICPVASKKKKKKHQPISVSAPWLKVKITVTSMDRYLRRLSAGPVR